MIFLIVYTPKMEVVEQSLERPLHRPGQNVKINIINVLVSLISIHYIVQSLNVGFNKKKVALSIQHNVFCCVKDVHNSWLA